MSNPIFIEYYPHTKSDCFKVKNPWSDYGSETMVLCEVSKGIELAKKRCSKYLTKKLNESLKEGV